MKKSLRKKITRMGGKAVLQKYGRSHFSALGKLSAKKRKRT